jgi:hypothetical protein
VGNDSGVVIANNLERNRGEFLIIDNGRKIDVHLGLGVRLPDLAMRRGKVVRLENQDAGAARHVEPGGQRSSGRQHSRSSVDRPGFLSYPRASTQTNSQSVGSVTVTISAQCGTFAADLTDPDRRQRRREQGYAVILNGRLTTFCAAICTGQLKEYSIGCRCSGGAISPVLLRCSSFLRGAAVQ